MATTAQQIVDGALGRSTKNTTRLADAGTELLRIIGIALNRISMVVAQSAPATFGAKQTIAAAGGAWTRPAGAVALYRIEATFGTTVKRVFVIDPNDAVAFRGLPALVELGNTLVPAANAENPLKGTETLTAYYAELLPAPASLGTTIDARYPDAFTSILEAEVALYLATKDGRGEEIKGLEYEITKGTQIFESWLESRNATTATRTGTGRAVPAGTAVSVPRKQ